MKGAIGVAAGGALGAGLAGAFRPISDVPVEVVSISYIGIKRLKDSPAPVGLPLIPIRLGVGGAFEGIPDAVPGQLLWYKYCGHERDPGSRASPSADNVIRYDLSDDRVAKGLAPWYGGSVGQPVRPVDFPDTEPAPSFSTFPGVGAHFRWRSEGAPAEKRMTGFILRTQREIGFERLTAEESDVVLDQWTVPDEARGGRFIAFGTFCPHLCCVPGFHESTSAINKGSGDKVFCTCHDSRFDPWIVTRYDRQVFLSPDFERM